MTLEMLMAFTVNPDPVRQEQVWESIQHSYNRQPWHIRQLLTETSIPASDKRAQFVGVEAYQAGGEILRDLFEADDGGWLQEPALLDRLVSDKLKANADEIAAEGWKWISVDTDLPYGHDHGLRALTGTPVDLTDDERAACEALREEYDRLEAEYSEADELPDEIDQRMDEIEAALEEPSSNARYLRSSWRSWRRRRVRQRRSRRRACRSSWLCPAGGRGADRRRGP